jgi:translation initiation factor IF-2
MTHKHRDSSQKHKPRLEVVLKCDSMGSLEAVTSALSEMNLNEVDISVIHRGVGDVSKSDVFLAETSSRLIAGFQVDVLQGMEKTLREHRVEVRLYDIIYRLTADIKAIGQSMTPPESQDQIIGSARVIALFKSSRKGMIIGCEVMQGSLSLGQSFRIISVTGPVYSGTIESIHRGEQAVQKAIPGQQVGIKIRDFNKARIGDLVESFRAIPRKVQRWEPRGEIIRDYQRS